MDNDIARDVNDPSAQLIRELQVAANGTTETFSSGSSSPDPRVPILHHLNADSSWLLQIPRPPETAGWPAGEQRKRKRKYTNLVFDPWLFGSQSDVASWFSTQTHIEAPKVCSIAEVEALALRAEDDSTIETKTNTHNDLTASDPSSAIDAILLSHEFTDHTHKATLLTVPASVPVYANPTAANLVRSWRHFNTVIAIPPFKGEGADWRTSGAPIAHHTTTTTFTTPPPTTTTNPPPQLTISRLEDPNDALYYHSALLLTFTQLDPQTTSPSAPATAILYTPHGLAPRALAPFTAASPPLRALALLHGLHDVRIAWGQQLNLGAHNALALQRVLRAPWWLPTHDEVKKGSGVVSWFLRRRAWAVEELWGSGVGIGIGMGMGMGGRGAGGDGDDRVGEVVDMVNGQNGEVWDVGGRRFGFGEVRNGECVLLG